MKLPVRLLRCNWPPNDEFMPGNPKFDALLADIRENGIREPLTINLDWIVLDGIHRLYVAKLLGIEAVDVRIWTGTEFIT
jgi:ParB-like chromosome segregation protein Spo0J